MEKMNGLQFDNIEAFKNATDETIEQYCKQNGIDSDNIPPTVWDDILTELKYKVFAPNRKFYKVKGNINNEYDVDKIYLIYDSIYKRQCNKRCKEIHLMGFIEMLDINKQTIYNLSSKKLTYDGIALDEKIREDNERSLESMLQDKSINPMKILPSLNRKHSWNMPGVREARKTEQQLLDRGSVEALPNKTAEALPELD